MTPGPRDCRLARRLACAFMFAGFALGASGVARASTGDEVADGASVEIAGSTLAEGRDAPDAGGTAAVTAAPAAVDASSWEFSASAYLWFSGMKGEVAVSPAVPPVYPDISFGDVLGALKFGAMGILEARKDRFVASADMIYMNLGASKNLEIRDTTLASGHLDLKAFIATAVAGYRAVDRDGSSLDLVGGMRINSLKAGLSLAGPARSVSGSGSETWVDPLVGARWKGRLGDKWGYTLYGDIGGFGVSSDLTWQLQATVEYALGKNWTMSGGWRHMDTDYDNNGFVFDMALDGPIMMFSYRF